jgi:hypothetical protein
VGSERVGESGVDERLAGYPLLDAMRGRRSRRFGMGMKIPDGPFAYESRHEPLPLTEAEEAALAFAACGVTGYALADLSYGRGQGGGMLAGLLGRTVASPDAINTVSVFVTNDNATYLLKRPQDFEPAEIPTLVELAGRGELVELYRRSRIKTSDGRAAPPVEPTYNFNINRWALYAPGGTYLLPVQEMTARFCSNPIARPTTLRWRSPCSTSSAGSSARGACSVAGHVPAAGRNRTRRRRRSRPPRRRPSRRPSRTASTSTTSMGAFPPTAPPSGPYWDTRRRMWTRTSTTVSTVRKPSPGRSAGTRTTDATWRP